LNKLHVLILSLLLTIAIANLTFILKPSVKNNREIVIVARVIDGDTLVLEDGRTVRLLNINAPEKDTPISKQATLYLKNYTGKEIEIESAGLEKYGRTLARLYAPNYLNLDIAQKGLASKFLVNENELKEFSKAEENAINNELGIWKNSKYSNCIQTSVDKIKEIALIKNICKPIDISGWILKDESRKQYKFTNTLNNALSLHSGAGNDNSTDVYWKEGNIWNNDRDTLYLFDSENSLVSFYSYGY